MHSHYISKLLNIEDVTAFIASSLHSSQSIKETARQTNLSWCIHPPQSNLLPTYFSYYNRPPW